MPSKLGSLWLNGPEWLKDRDCWPNQPEVKESTETNHERITPKRDTLLQAMELDKPVSDVISSMLDKYSSYWKLLRVTAYIKRFCHNCRGKRLTGPLSTEEMKAAEQALIIQVQQCEEVKSNVNVEKDDDGVLRYVGRVPGYRPIYLPRDHQFVQLLISYHHRQRLHGGVSSTMASLREKYWILKLRSKVKSAVHKCNTCKRYRVTPVPSTTKSTLPSFRAELTYPFAVIGVDFAGPIIHKHSNTIGKAYIALFTCASIRAVHLKLCPDLSAKEFKRVLKEFIARRGCPQVIVSDNGKTFVATSKCLSTLSSFMGQKHIVWKFNLSRAPWWGGFFERLIGIMKRCLSKVIGRKLLSFSELEEVLLDVEQTMNNRPLAYQGEEFEEPVLTPNILLRGKNSPIVEEDLEMVGEKITKRAAFVQRSKEQLRKRFLREYVHALDERRRSVMIAAENLPKTGGVVLLKGDTKDKAKWKLGRVVRRVTGNDGTVRGLKLKLGNGYAVERPLQLVCDLEIGGESAVKELNPKAKPFIPEPRPSRKSKDMARDFIKSVRGR